MGWRAECDWLACKVAWAYRLMTLLLSLGRDGLLVVLEGEARTEAMMDDRSTVYLKVRAPWEMVTEYGIRNVAAGKDTVVSESSWFLSD